MGIVQGFIEETDRRDLDDDDAKIPETQPADTAVRPPTSDALAGGRRAVGAGVSKSTPRLQKLRCAPAAEPRRKPMDIARRVRVDLPGAS